LKPSGEHHTKIGRPREGGPQGKKGNRRGGTQKKPAGRVYNAQEKTQGEGSQEPIQGNEKKKNGKVRRLPTTPKNKGEGGVQAKRDQGGHRSGVKRRAKGKTVRPPFRGGGGSTEKRGSTTAEKKKISLGKLILEREKKPENEEGENTVGKRESPRAQG